MMPRRSPPVVRLGFVVFALCCVAVPAEAENKDAARAAFRRANQHYALGELPQALESFKEAYRAFEDPTFLYNIGQCQRRLGKTEDAIQSFRSYLRTDAPDRAEAERQIERLTEQAKVEREEREREQKAAQQRVAQAREREAAAALVRPPQPEPTPVASAAPVAPLPRPLYRRWWLWTIVGVGVVGIGLGVGLGVGLTQSSFRSTLPDFGAGHMALSF